MLIERTLFKQIEPHVESKEAIIISGMRRVGKTSLLRYILEAVPSPNKLFLDLENPLNRRYFEEENYERIKGALETLGLDLGKKAYLFLDEIQYVRNLSSAIKYLMDHYDLKCFLTGSASFYLKNFFTESLAGRKYLFELFPLDFEEFLRFKKSPLRLSAEGVRSDKRLWETFSVLCDEYCRWGGFPGVVLKTDPDEKKRSLDDIFTSYYQAEVLALGDFRKNEVVRDLMLLLMQRAGSKLDVSKLASELGISRITLTEYLAFLEGTYFIHLVRPFSRNRDAEIRKTPKIYLCDSGLLNQLARVSEGALFENSVFQILRGRGELNYFQKKSGVEIDFIQNKKIAYEVKLSAGPGELKYLKNMADELEIRDYALVCKKWPRGLAEHEKIRFVFDL